MWLICGKCNRHLALWNFNRHIRNTKNFQLAYECKECTRKHANNNSGIYKKHLKVRRYKEPIKKPTIKKPTIKNPISRNRSWSDLQILEFMGFKLSSLIDVGYNKDDFDTVSFNADRKDLEKLNQIRDMIGYIPNSSIIRIALRYLFYTLKL